MREPHEKVYRSKKRIIIDNFIGGIAWGVGTTIGVSVLLGLITFLMSKLNIVPFIGNFVADVNIVAEQKTEEKK